MYYWAGSIFWILIGAGVAIHACRLGLGSLHQPGPGFIFFVAAVLLILTGSIDLAMAFLKNLKEGKEGRRIQLGPRWKRVLFLLIVLCFYVYAFNILGFLVATFLLMVFLFKGIEPTKWWITVVGSITTILISYGVFQLWLKVPFPRGFLEF